MVAQNNAALIPFTATGATTSRSLGDGAALTLDAKLDFGVGHETATASENVSRLQEALAAVSAAGGGTLRLRGDVVVNDTVYKGSYPNVSLVGDGSDISHDTGDQGAQSSTKLIWNGSAGGTILDDSSPAGAGNQKIRGGSVRGVHFKSGTGIAATALAVKSRADAVYEDLFFEEFSGAHLDIGCVATLGEAKDTQGCLFNRIGSRTYTQTGALIVLDGVADANTSMNLFTNMNGLHHKDGAAIVLKNCDNNMFLRTRIFRAPGGVGQSVDFQGSNAGAGQAARCNAFMGLTAASVIARGTASYTHPSLGNSVLLLDQDNGMQVPTIEAGATLAWSFVDGKHGGMPERQAIIGNTDADIAYARSLAGGAQSLILINGSAAHTIIGTPDGVRWTMRIAGGKVVWTLISGDGANASLQAPIFELGSTGSAGPTWRPGTGSPEGVVTAVPGSFYIRTDGTPGTILYFKESGTGNTGWVAKW